jgi:hypothetical protein
MEGWDGMFLLFSRVSISLNVGEINLFSGVGLCTISGIHSSSRFTLRCFTSLLVGGILVLVVPR